MPDVHGWPGLVRASWCWWVMSVSVAWAAEPAGGSKTVPIDRPGYQQQVAPFLKQYCGACHFGSEAEAEFRVDEQSLPIDFGVASTRLRWHEVVDVLNSHSMPPEGEPQPSAAEVARVVDWITEQAVQAELVQRSHQAVLRRMNREEYRNTIRDLMGVDFDPAGFPEDPTAGGFDNNGQALTISPLHMELYLAAAQQILDRALVEGDRPAAIRWKFNPLVGPADQTRLRIDEKNNPIVNGNNNQTEGDWVVVHHASWDKAVGARDFRVPVAGDYLIRIRAAGRSPSRGQVIESARRFLEYRRDEQDAKNPAGKRWTQQQFQDDLKHFETNRMYDYGPPRVKLVVQLGPQPRTIAEFDADGQVDQPKTHEFRTRMTTETAGISIEYAYAIPTEVENFWMQGNDRFARPELLIDWFELEGPLYDGWPPSSHTSILFPSPLQKSNPREYVRQVLTRFMTKAFRRPVTKSEVESKLALYQPPGPGESLVDAVKLPLIAVLTSPHFLYLLPADAGGGSDRLTDHQLATRLSYFLWSSTPDEELLQLAQQGRLKDPAVRQQQVDRLLADSRSEAFVKDFTGQWLGLREVGANPPAIDLFPQYDRHLETSMIGESEAFVREFLHHDLDVRQMVRSEFVTINERLARFYGIPDVRGDQFRKVPVPSGVQRGGIVTQASILTITSNGTRTSPVKRGTWILKTLLGIDPGLPVANAGEIAPKVPGIDKATVRQRLEIHRELPQCARCHSKIDPLGFALENFDASGEWREREGFGYKGRVQRDDPLIDAASKMPDGREINGVAGLQQAMLDQSERFLSSLSTKVLTYALGRELSLSDRQTVQQAVSHLQQTDHSLRSLLKFVVASDAFSRR
jgi:hypothetical protein